MDRINDFADSRSASYRSTGRPFRDHSLNEPGVDASALSGFVLLVVGHA
jgi:hypothetical protein